MDGDVGKKTPHLTAMLSLFEASQLPREETATCVRNCHPQGAV